MSKKTVASKSLLIIISIIFVILFLFMLIISILINLCPDPNNLPQGCPKSIIFFLQHFSNFETLSDPFSIFIEMLISIGGVFFGIRIGQWIDNIEEKEKLSELWKKINSFLVQLKNNINNNDISIYELAEYKMYWDSLQRANSTATRILQENPRYAEISFAFSFLTFYINSWSSHSVLELSGKCICVTCSLFRKDVTARRIASAEKQTRFIF